MRLVLLCFLCAILAGCAGSKPVDGESALPVGSKGAVKPNAIVTPGGTLPGRVALVNAHAGYVVLTFPLGSAPTTDKKLNVYRAGLKMAEIKITSQRRDNAIIADIVTGECQAGDEVKEN